MESPASERSTGKWHVRGARRVQPSIWAACVSGEWITFVDQALIFNAIYFAGILAARKPAVFDVK